MLFEKSDDTGLSFLKAELVTSGLLAEGTYTYTCRSAVHMHVQCILFQLI